MTRKSVIRVGFPLVLLLMSGCSTWRKLNKTEKGGTIGAGGGILIGAAVGGPVGAVVGGSRGGIWWLGDRRRGAVIDALVRRVTFYPRI